MFVIIQDWLGSGPLDLPACPPLAELAVRVVLFLLGGGESYADESLVVEEVPAEVARLGGGLFLREVGEREIKEFVAEWGGWYVV